MGVRALGVLNDAESAAGGSNLDRLLDPGPLAYPTPSTYLPVVSGNADPAYEDRARNDEVRGFRGGQAPYAWRAAPNGTFRSRLYPALAKWLVPRLLGDAAAATGVAPAAITSRFSPVAHGGRLPSSNLVLVREDQVDYLWGAWVESCEFEVGDDSEPWVTVTLRALYHETKDIGVLSFTPDTDDFVDPYAGVTMKASTGEVGDLEEIECIASANFTFNNTLSDDDAVRYCKGRNVIKVLDEDTDRYIYRHYPDRHKVGRQVISGSLGFGSVQPGLEERRLLAQAKVLQLEMTGNPAGTTPAADQLIRFTFYAHVLSGGGAGELQDEGEIKSSYEFTAHTDPATGKDFETAFVDAAAVALPA